VTLVEGERRLLPREEEFACAQVTEALAGYGVDIRTGRKAVAVAQDGDRVTLTTADGATAEGDTLLVALGRAPQTEGLGLEAVGLEAGRTVDVEAHCQVPGHPWLYAIGDVNGRALFTHMGKYQARLAADHILGHDRQLAHGADGPLSPRVIFTEPQVAAVGHTTESARAAGLVTEVYETSTSGNAGGSFYGRNAPGTTRWIVDSERKIVVGCTITGAEVADFLHAATIAVVGEVPLAKLRHAVPSFPTRSEIWLQLVS
jgi:dihydrolipoamide dehydrogenase